MGKKTCLAAPIPPLLGQFYLCAQNWHANMPNWSWSSAIGVVEGGVWFATVGKQYVPYLVVCVHYHWILLLTFLHFARWMAINISKKQHPWYTSVPRVDGPAQHNDKHTSLSNQVHVGHLLWVWLFSKPQSSSRQLGTLYICSKQFMIWFAM